MTIGVKLVRTLRRDDKEAFLSTRSRRVVARCQHAQGVGWREELDAIEHDAIEWTECVGRVWYNVVVLIVQVGAATKSARTLWGRVRVRHADDREHASARTLHRELETASGLAAIGHRARCTDCSGGESRCEEGGEFHCRIDMEVEIGPRRWRLNGEIYATEFAEAPGRAP